MASCQDIANDAPPADERNLFMPAQCHTAAALLLQQTSLSVLCVQRCLYSRVFWEAREMKYGFSPVYRHPFDPTVCY